MSDATTYLRNKLNDHVLKHVGYTSPATVYLALFTSATDPSGAGTEVVGGSYGRQAITVGSSSGGDSLTTSDISFTGMPACTVTNVAVFDASTSGNMLLQKALDFPEECGSGDTLKWTAGSLTFSTR